MDSILYINGYINSKLFWETKIKRVFSTPPNLLFFHDWSARIYNLKLTMTNDPIQDELISLFVERIATTTKAVFYNPDKDNKYFLESDVPIADAYKEEYDNCAAHHLYYSCKDEAYARFEELRYENLILPRLDELIAESKKLDLNDRLATLPYFFAKTLATIIEGCKDGVTYRINRYTGQMATDNQQYEGSINYLMFPYRFVDEGQSNPIPQLVSYDSKHLQNPQDVYMFDELDEFRYNQEVFEHMHIPYDCRHIVDHNQTYRHSYVYSVLGFHAYYRNYQFFETLIKLMKADMEGIQVVVDIPANLDNPDLPNSLINIILHYLCEMGLLNHWFRLPIHMYTRYIEEAIRFCDLIRDTVETY